MKTIFLEGVSPRQVRLIVSRPLTAEVSFSPSIGFEQALTRFDETADDQVCQSA
jgi:hypothetical protein